jgi:sugar/nucleoside kinase (ribokinase family)
MNKEEAQSLLKKKVSMEKAAQELGKQALNVVITDGPRGAVGYDGELYTLRQKKVSVIETTGAGDAFGAGTLAGLLKRKSLPDAMKLGQKEAESVLRHVGAKQDLLRK